MLQRRDGNAYTWRRVDEAEEPLVLALVALVGVDAKLWSMIVCVLICVYRKAAVDIK
jgi:hypothetical protein